MALLELSNIQFNYSDKELYKGITLKMNPGEHCVLVGVNGSGKTTLLSMIVGELSPDEGKIIWEKGTTFSYLDQQLKVAQDMPVYQYLYGVYEDLFEKEKQMERLYEQSATDPDHFEKILEKAERIQDELNEKNFYGLQEKVGRLTDGLGFDQSHLEAPLSRLSSGQREKAYLAKMLLEEKDVLIMDEPTANLDYGNAIRVLEQIRQLAGSGYTILQATHQPDQAFLFADEVLALKDGRILAQGSPREVIDSRLIETLYGVHVAVERLYDDRLRVLVPVSALRDQDKRGGPEEGRSRQR